MVATSCHCLYGASTTAPTPEPATFALAGTALAVLGWNRIARRR
ncbi:PEP-CTERM sorting domain-containing protein [Bryobacter aggregatus]